MHLKAAIVLTAAIVWLVGTGCAPDKAAEDYAERQKRWLSRMVAPTEIQVWANQAIAEHWTNSPGLVLPIGTNEWPVWMAQAEAQGGFFGVGINLRESPTNSFVAMGWGGGASRFWGLYVGPTNLPLPVYGEHQCGFTWYPGCYIWVSKPPWSR